MTFSAMVRNRWCGNGKEQGISVYSCCATFPYRLHSCPVSMARLFLVLGSRLHGLFATTGRGIGIGEAFRPCGATHSLTLDF